MKPSLKMVRTGLILLAAIFLAVGVGFVAQKTTSAANGTYKILAWNDLGMHCYNKDFSDLAVLPPYNNLWVQVVQAGDPPKLVTTGITVNYSYPDNTYSVGKTNFWTYSKALFGVDLPPNVGLKGKGLSGAMDLSGDHFIAEGIPITEFSDSAPTVPQPYQLATVVVKNSITGEVLATQSVVTPTSSEMRCDNCHGDTGPAKPGSPTGKVETNILQLHDEENGTNLMNSRPVLCANCHASNALGAPGKPGLPNLSKAMHSKHSGKVPNTLDGCYNCHPGPQTKCLRDVMSTKKGMTCVDCHGTMSKVASNPNPWLNEPRCDTCHNTGQYHQDQPLYRLSKDHGGLYCEACHDSTHAISPSREANDAIKFIALQGSNGPLGAKCLVCHTTVPVSNIGPHGIGAQVSTYNLSGTVGVAGVTLAYSDGTPKTVISDGSGNYIITVPSGWAGVITPIKSGYSFSPTSRDYAATPVLSNLIGQNFIPTIIGVATFADVPVSYWAWQQIELLVKNGITSGCSTNPSLYCPASMVTRDQMAIFLLRAEHGSSYVPPAAVGVFADVPPTYWAAAWIEQLASEGITSGCSTTPRMFCPGNVVTRDQMAVFLGRTKHGIAFVPPAPAGIFADVPPAYWAASWIELLAADGVTGGCSTSPKLYCPGGAVMRDQMAIFLVNAFGLK